MLRDKIREYLKVSGAVDDMTKIVDTANNYMLNNTAGYSDEQRAEMLVLHKQYMLIMNSRLDEFNEKFVDLYSEFYTEEDIDALIAYNNSPIAKKVREVGNKIMGRAIEISSDFNKELLKQLDGATLHREVN